MRSGVIPYTVYRSNVYFLLGRDRRSRDICDFGGGLKAGETPAQAGLREFDEEAVGLFRGLCDEAALAEQRCVTLRLPATMTLFFVPLAPAWLARAAPAFQRLRRAAASAERRELDCVVWVGEKAFLRLVYARGAHPPMWQRLRAFLQRAIAPAAFGAQLRAAYYNRWKSV